MTGLENKIFGDHVRQWFLFKVWSSADSYFHKMELHYISKLLNVKTSNSNAKYPWKLENVCPIVNLPSRVNITLLAEDSLLHVKPVVTRQPGFRQELVEQSTDLTIPSPEFPTSRAIQIRNYWLSDISENVLRNLVICNK